MDENGDSGVPEQSKVFVSRQGRIPRWCVGIWIRMNEWRAAVSRSGPARGSTISCPHRAGASPSGLVRQENGLEARLVEPVDEIWFASDDLDHPSPVNHKMP